MRPTTRIAAACRSCRPGRRGNARISSDTEGLSQNRRALGFHSPLNGDSSAARLRISSRSPSTRPLQRGIGTSPQQPGAYHDSRDVERPADRHLLFGPNFKTRHAVLALLGAIAFVCPRLGSKAARATEHDYSFAPSLDDSVAVRQLVTALAMGPPTDVREIRSPFEHRIAASVRIGSFEQMPRIDAPWRVAGVAQRKS
jgi:hypothetical protein